ncbi:MAG TPA: MATE family efflux transporter [Gammaproteobacteria bacterium]|nr:MATE family efflux transporter [Gammaproteobacteria bacterium]
MKDLTQDSVAKHLVTMAAPVAAGMLVQTLYLLVDLYVVAALGDAAVAGVGSAGTLMFVVAALTQVLGVGAVALISQAVGRGDRLEANRVFNQALLLAAGCGAAMLLLGYAFTSRYVAAIAADAATREAGTAFLYWFLPGFALQFGVVTMGSALRGTGIVKPTVIAQAFTVVLNTALAPVLIAGWGTGRPLGVAGAGLASSVSIAAGGVLLGLYFVKLEKYVAFRPALWRPQPAVWKRMLGVGLPAGAELALMFVYLGIVYALIAGFGAGVEAAFGIGSRIVQAILLPTMAIAFAAGPIAGQNFGAGRPERVRETLTYSMLLNALVMGLVTLLLQWRPEALIALFSPDADVQSIGASFLRIISWAFLAQGIVFICSGLFQGLGNTRPALLSSGIRLASFVALALWLSGQPGFGLEELWYASVAAVVLQAGASLGLLRGQFRKRLAEARPDCRAASLYVE